MEPTPIKLKLANIHCTDEGDSIGSAEPYLWTVFFKIDGDTVHVDNTLTLQGTATVVTTFGNHRDLIARDVDAGDNIPIPPAIGEFSTVVKPIPVNPVPGTTLAGVVGCIVVLLEQDETPNAAVAQGHVALNQAVQSALDELIPTLNFGHQSPTDDDIKKLTDKVGKKVEDAISDHVSFWDLLSGFGNEDDKIGTAVFFSSQNDICDAGLGGITLFEDWKNEGRWQISGTLTAVINESRSAAPMSRRITSTIWAASTTAGAGGWRRWTSSVTSSPASTSSRKALMAPGRWSRCCSTRKRGAIRRVSISPRFRTVPRPTTSPRCRRSDAG